MIASVLRWPVHRIGGVCEGGGHEAVEVIARVVRGIDEDDVLLRTRGAGEVDAVHRARPRIESGEAADVDLLQPGHRPGELPLADTAGSLETDTPSQSGVRVEGDEGGEVVDTAARAIREGTTGVNHRRVEAEGGQEGVAARTEEVAGIDWLRHAARTADERGPVDVQMDQFTFDRLVTLTRTSPSRPSSSFARISRDIHPMVVKKRAYVFLGFSNIRERRATAPLNGDLVTYRYPLSFLDDDKDLLYANGGASVYR